MLSFLFELFDVEEANLPVARAFEGEIGEELVFAKSSLLSGAAVDVFHGFESFEVEAGLGFTPLGVLAELAAGEEDEGLFELVLVHAFFDEGLDVL